MSALAGTLMNSSADLVARVCQGDSDAFRLIFERYSRPVIRFFYDMVNYRALADKAVMDLSDNKPEPVAGLLSKELNDLIRRSLAALDEDKRLVFTLKVLHQCSYEEIAMITGFSLAKLKTDLHRARVEMRKRISPYAGVGYEV